MSKTSIEWLPGSCLSVCRTSGDTMGTRYTAVMFSTGVLPPARRHARRHDADAAAPRTGMESTGSRSRLRTYCPSILIVSNCGSRRSLNELKPAPTSSSANVQPFARIVSGIGQSNALTMARRKRQVGCTAPARHEVGPLDAAGSVPEKAASRCMNASGLSTRCVVPSRHGAFSASRTCPAALTRMRSSDSAGRAMYRHSRSSRLRSCASIRTAA
jgi:hypothetical protein